jgi:hypothetical protein
MISNTHPSRRDFTTAGLMALFGAMVITVGACSDDSSGGSPTAPSGSVELSAGEVTQARDGQRVAKTSSTDFGSGFGNHSHIVTFNA